MSFDQFALSKAEDVARAHVHLLRSDPVVAEWATVGGVVQIVRAADPLTLPNWRPPFIAVGLPEEDRTFNPSQRAEASVVVVDRIVYEERRSHVQADARTVVSLVHHLTVLAARHPLLDLEDGAPHAQTLRAFDRISLTPVEIGKGRVELAQELRFVYELEMSSTDWS